MLLAYMIMIRGSYIPINNSLFTETSTFALPTCNDKHTDTMHCSILHLYRDISWFHLKYWTRCHISQLKNTSNANIYNNVSNEDRDRQYCQYHSESDRTICDIACRDLIISVIVFNVNVIMCLASHWLTMSSIRVGWY